MRLICACVILIAPLTFAAVDIVGYWNGVFVSWDNNSETSYLTEVLESREVLEFGQGNPSLGFTVFDGTPVLILATSSPETNVDDSIHVINPATLSELQARAVSASDLSFLSAPEFSEGTIQVCRNQNEEDVFYISANPSIPCSGDMENNIVSARFRDDSDSGIYISDTLGVDYDSSFGWITSYSRPVCCLSGPAVQTWSFYASYASSFLGHYIGWHEIDGSPVQGDFEPMAYDMFYQAGMGSYDPGYIRSVGSCCDEVLCFWTTQSNEELWYTVLDAGSSPPNSAPAPFCISVSSAVAMSSQPMDNGLLLVWQQEGEIRCAHWNGEWNSFYHVVETGVPGLNNGDLAVCSINDGYVIAWASSPQPEIRFVERDSVTSIDQSGGMSLDEGVKIFPNPVSAGQLLNLQAGSFPTGTVTIYNLQGRSLLEYELDDSGSGAFPVGINTGTYFVRIESEGEPAVRKLVVL